MLRISRKQIQVFAASLALWAGIASEAYGDNDPLGIVLSRYACTVQNGINANGSSFTASPAEVNRVRPHQAVYTALGYASNADAATVWRSFLESDFLIGKGTTLTRAWDIFEEFDYNFRTPNSAANSVYWSDYYTTYSSSTLSWAPTLSGGFHNGESPVGNNNLLALLDEHYLMYDPDGTLSAYRMGNGTLNPNYECTWTQFSDGFFQGRTLTDCLQYMIGAEDTTLFFLDGENTIIQYRLSSPTTVTFQSAFQYNLSGELADYTLRQIIDGEVAGYTYIGWDVGAMIINVDANFRIPEPSTALLGLLGIAGLAARRRR